MTNIAKTVNEYLAAELSDIPDIYNDVFPFETGDCLISRHDPGNARETSFIDGSATGLLPLAYYMRSEDAEKARKTLTDILDALDGVELSMSGVRIECEAVTLPNFISVDDAGQTIYTAEINCKYIRKGE